MPLIALAAVAGITGLSGLFSGLSLSNKLGSALKVLGFVVGLFLIFILSKKYKLI